MRILVTNDDGVHAQGLKACEEIAQKNKEPGDNRERQWTELRIRRPDLVGDNVTLPLQRLREAISELVKGSEDKDTGQELIEANRRLTEIREGIATFLRQDSEEHVYWVERTGKMQQNLTLSAAPIDVAAYLRHRLFGAETSVVMTSATLSIADQTTRSGAATSLQYSANS